MTTDRAVLLRYLRDGEPRRGSGLRVGGRFVLTADHCADGTDHVIIVGGEEYPATVYVRSRDASVDVAVLLASALPAVEPLKCAVLDREVPWKVSDCVALGFPRWKDSDSGPLLAQVPGNIPTAEGVDPQADPGRVPPMSLKITNPDIRDRVPKGNLDQPGSQWAGMSGAVVVTADDRLVGVVRGHSPAEGVGSLTATRLEAITSLARDVAALFLAALQMPDLREWPRVPLPGDNRAVKVAPTAPSSLAAAEPMFSTELRDRYKGILMAAGLDVPDRWGRVELERLRRDHQRQASGTPGNAELLEALCDALDAMPVLQQIGGHDIGFRKLQYLYQRHVGRWPDSGSREGMLVLAASARISEQRRALLDPGYQPESLTALARFMLGVAGYRKAPITATLDDPDLRGLSDWLTEALGHQREDAAAYLADRVGGRIWALIELRAEDSTEREWPDRIIVDLINEHGPGRTRNVLCTAQSDEGVLHALRNAVDWLPEGEVCIDLIVPRHWLEAGVEHWEVVQVGGRYESLSRHLEPRLRWSMHRRDRWLRDRLSRRFGRLAWLAAPEMIPEAVATDPARFADWLDSWEADRTTHPPYFTGSSPVETDQDLLGAMLRDGCGFVVWFAAGTPETIKQYAADLAEGLSALERRHDLPRTLAAKLRDHRPTIIWSDPDGRSGFQLPAPRRGGTLRGGTR